MRPPRPVNRASERAGSSPRLLPLVLGSRGEAGLGLGCLRRSGLGPGLGLRLGISLARAGSSARVSVTGRRSGGGLVPLVVVPAAGERQR